MYPFLLSLPYYSLTIILPPLFPSSPLSYWPHFSSLLSPSLSTVTTSQTSSSTQRTKDYEDVLKKALCDLSKSYPVETHELLYNFRLEVILLSSFFLYFILLVFFLPSVYLILFHSTGSAKCSFSPFFFPFIFTLFALPFLFISATKLFSRLLFFIPNFFH